MRAGKERKSNLNIITLIRKENEKTRPEPCHWQKSAEFNFILLIS
ncbi:hypothetical protein HMPREF0868_1436 [Mageeibacillus indolicus UPII9-5]|uniref:Uncharacterized protein n=1 Tax=Mageeibacillus indolicus (strain UPII9-5) TaxID=699246 RepID=D3QZ06_MAGIU|nr:hypothetical protein HMPREF0868_1436 [Mageeibacillus indolicus UPII9-5]